MAAVNCAERSFDNMREELEVLKRFGDDISDGEKDEKIRLYEDIETQRLVTAEQSSGVC